MKKVQITLALFLASVIGLELGCNTAAKTRIPKPSPAVEKLPPPEPCDRSACVVWMI